MFQVGAKGIKQPTKPMYDTYMYNAYNIRGTRLRHNATSRKVAGSSPDEVEISIYLILPAAL
jgi:hypothetical protein